VLTIWSLGAVVLHEHLRRLVDVDLLSPQLGTDPNLAGYIGPALEMLGGGILTPAFFETIRDTATDRPPPATSTATTGHEPEHEGAS
jgi:hypothetical protein